MKRILKKNLPGLLLLFAACIIAVKFVSISDLNYAREQIQEWAGALGKNVYAADSEPAEQNIPTMNGTGSPVDTQVSQEPVNTGEEYSFDGEMYPYYALLDEDQKAVYSQIYANALVQNSSFALTQPLTESSLSDTICSVYNDHPELFWLKTSYSYCYNSSGQVVSLNLFYYMTGSALEQAQSKFDAAAQSIASGAAEYETAIEQELYVHDAINQMTVYNTAADMNQSAYSALVNGSTVCAGYSRAFQYVMQQLGYPVYYCTGTSDGQDHAWNIIELEGDFYNVDLTWDDSISEAYGANAYTYFNLTDAAISVDHTRSALSSKLPACTSTSLAYTTVYGDTISIDDIDVGSGTHADRDMIITPSSPEIIDWHDSAAQDNGEAPPSLPQGSPEQEFSAPEHEISSPGQELPDRPQDNGAPLQSNDVPMQNNGAPLGAPGR